MTFAVHSPNPNPNQNRLLASLPGAEFDRLAPHLEPYAALGEMLTSRTSRCGMPFFRPPQWSRQHYVTVSGAAAEMPAWE
jgi:hypothetical protein